MKKLFIYSCRFALLCTPMLSLAQKDSNRVIQRISSDTAVSKLNMDATYNRPFLKVGKLPLAIGGYLEANSQYEQTDGVSEGLSFQMRRLTLFFSSTITRNIKFLSELEFEDGTKEINLEYAAMDMEFHPLLTLRGGIILNPIGAFNQNHDGPRWDFIDRPLSATTILPATLSNVGFGIHGKYFSGNWAWGYEAYLTNGFDDHVISNADNRTSLAAGKSHPEKFEESNSGLPMVTGKLTLRHRKIAEIGLSAMNGVYNRWRMDGIPVAPQRSITALAFDCNTALFKNRLSINAEAAKVLVDVPATYVQNFGTEQFGCYADVLVTILERPVFAWEKAKVNIGNRFEYVDYNQDTFKATGTGIADHAWALVPSLAFRPAGTTVIRFNYRYQVKTDLFGNPPSLTGAFLLGFSSYF